MKNIILFILILSRVQLYSQYSIEGFVNDETNSPYGKGYMFLYLANGTSSTEPVSVVSYENGVFDFPNVASGEYIILALPVVDFVNNYSDSTYLATFYVNKQTPELANSITITSLSLLDLDIRLNKRSVITNADHNLYIPQGGAIKPYLMYNTTGELVESFLVSSESSYVVDYQSFPIGLYDSGFPTNNKTIEFEEIINVNQSTNSSFFIIDVGLTSLSSSRNNSDLNVYPNPCKDVLYLDDTEGLVSVEITNFNGEVVQFEINDLALIDVSDLETGIFILKLKYKDYSTQAKIRKL